MPMKLNVIAVSTRPGRKGIAVALWAHERAVAHGAFEAELVDLAEFALPVYDEPRHPALQQYEHEHTRRWAASVAAGDAYVIVAPEYNYGPTPALVNALTYVYKEWSYKPAGIVSYGGVSGGLRGAQAIKPLLSALKVVPLFEGVAIQWIAKHVDDEGVFTADEPHELSVRQMLDELARWAEALGPMRE